MGTIGIVRFSASLGVQSPQAITFSRRRSMSVLSQRRWSVSSSLSPAQRASASINFQAGFAAAMSRANSSSPT
ncbi:MAG: hypothetical protein U0790_01120 [Isosphaeraceae bacterium]